MSASDRRRFLANAGLLALGGPAGARAASGGFSLSDLQERTFRFFWETTDPRTGLAPDRWPSRSPSSVAAVGFALTAYPIGERRGWISRAEGRNRTLATLRFFDTAPQGPQARGMAGYKGFFYHFLDMETGTRSGTTELSTIDTTLLLAGMLFAQSWYDRNEPGEAEIRALVDRIYGRVEWPWFRANPPFVAMGWHPETGFIPSDWDHFDESPILYLLALGSPTHPLEPDSWRSYTATFDQSWGSAFGEPHIQFAPLFGHQYPHVWVDFRGIRDAYNRRRGLDYFENSRRATVAQRAYAMTNPAAWTGYGPDIWGLTACDGPGNFTLSIGGRPRRFFAYFARGAGGPDDGTIAPTAAGGSFPFAPDLCRRALMQMHRRYGPLIYGRYGFLDSFNPTLDVPTAVSDGRVVPGIGWVAQDYLGIDQGPILAMLENHRSGLVWRTMRRNPHLRRGLALAGFQGGWIGRTT
jgi:hypothetical protein